MINNLSEFISQSHADNLGADLWTVFADGERRRGIIYNCIGKNEYEAKENAWHYIQELKKELNK